MSGALPGGEHSPSGSPSHGRGAGVRQTCQDLPGHTSGVSCQPRIAPCGYWASMRIRNRRDLLRRRYPGQVYGRRCRGDGDLADPRRGRADSGCHPGHATHARRETGTGALCSLRASGSSTGALSGLRRRPAKGAAQWILLEPVVRPSGSLADVVLTFDESGAYGHPDHVVASLIATDACRAAGDPAQFPDQLESRAHHTRRAASLHSCFPKSGPPADRPVDRWLRGSTPASAAATSSSTR